MPAYDYDCAACGRRFEVSHGVHADSPTDCPFCGKGPVRKAISAPAIHYKGSGWAKKERRATATPGAAKTAADASSTTEGGSSAGSESADKSTPAAAKPADGSATTATD
jgi:putative FmdB family regulatory protein